MTEELSRVGEEHASNRSRVCKCGRVAVEKVVGPRSANRGLRYLCCDRFVLFGKKNNSCRFFEWIDQPRVSKEQRKEAQAVLHKENGAALGNGALLQPAIRTRNAVTDLEKKCETIEGLHVNKETFELEIRVPKDDPPQTQVHKNGRNAGMGIPITSQQGLIAHDGAHIVMEIESDAAQMTYDDRVFLGKHPQSSPTNSFQPKTGDTLKGADTAVSEALKDKDTNQESKQSLENAFELLETPTCLCWRAAVLKTVKSKGPNKGLRFWVCSNSQPFYMKNKKSELNAGEESCKFFRWIDEPRVSKEQKKKAQALLQKEKGAASGKRALRQPELRTQSAVRDLEKRCKTTEGLHVNKENFELEMRFSHNDLPHTQVGKDVGNAIMDIPSASFVTRDGADVTMENGSNAAQMTYNGGFFLAEHLQSSTTLSVQPDSRTYKLNATLQQNQAVIEDHGLNLSAGDTLKGADTSISEVAKDKNTNQEGMQSLENASESLETPTCLCSRAAVLKTVKSKGPNTGLRFWVCANSQPFYVKKKSKLNAGEESCKFFRWVDTPFEKSDTQKNQEKQRRKDTQKRKELSSLS